MYILNKVIFFDSTLRDGSHAVKQKVQPQCIEAYCKQIDAAGMHTVIVGHGNGLGASSVQMGFCAMNEIEMLKVAKRNLERTPLGTFITVGFGTIKEHVLPAIREGVEIFCIATHCTEADTMKKYIEYLCDMGKEVYGVLMNIHLTSPDEILKQACLIEEYGADGVILMDSAGASSPEDVEKIVSLLYEHLNMRIGFHPHNNMGMAVANAYTAIKCGASIIDGTIGGFGAGAGNCQLEALQALLMKEGILTGAKLYPMLDAQNNIINDMFGFYKGVDSTCIVSGYAGVVSTFKNRVEQVAKDYKLDSRDIFIELGKRKAIAGQDDLILEVAKEMKEREGMQIL